MECRQLTLAGYESKQILESIKSVPKISRTPRKDFGDGQSGKKFAEILTQDNFWPIEINKVFIDSADYIKEQE
jgi:UDP-N-acetylglucosamine 2-epimerase (hydrolysing)